MKCSNCGGTDRVIKYDKKMAFCIHCEGALPRWGDSIIFDAEPTRCPRCGNRDIEGDLFDDDNLDTDEELAIDYGVDPDTADMDEIARFMFGYDYVWCDECDTGFHYGPRYYYDPKKNGFTVERPPTKAEIAKREQQAQEAAGQMRLFDAQSE